MLYNPELEYESMAPLISIDSVWGVAGVWFILCSIFHVTWVCAHSETWEEFLYNLPCGEGRKILDAIEGFLDDMYEAKIKYCNEVSFSACPKRCLRARICARRCERRRRQREAEAENHEEVPCPIQVCCMSAVSLCRLNLPAPLPFIKKRRHKDSKQTTHQGSTVDVQTSHTVEDTILSQEQGRKVSRDSSTLASSLGATSLASKNGSHFKQASPMQTSRSALINLARMQQWKTILEQQDQLLTRRQAKYRDEDGLYPLHWACSGGPPVKLIQALLDCYPSAARKHDKEGSLPLHFATHYGASPAVVEALLSVYPDAARVQDKYGRTPLYSAVDKSAGMEVLQMLVRADPETILTPCLPVNVRRAISLAQQRGLHVPRTIGIRTPLFLAWADVLADARARERLDGKKWEKASHLLRTLQAHYTEQASYFPTRYQPLSASIVLDRFLPEALIPLLIGKLADHVRLADPTLDRLPLHVAAATPHYSSERFRQILEYLLEAYPEAAVARDFQGKSPLSLAVASGKSWKQDGLETLFRAAPEAVRWADQETELTPMLLAASRPQVVPSSLDTADDGSESSSDGSIDELLKSFDPYNILTRKHSEELKRSRQRSESSLVDEPGDPDLLQLDTIFALLHVEPSQIVA